MNQLIDPALLNQVTTAAVSVAVTGVLGWLVTGGKKAIGNWGKTKMQIAQEEHDRALKAVADAAKTPCDSDDAAAAQLLDAADRHLTTARQLQALADGLSSAAPAIAQAAPPALINDAIEQAFGKKSDPAKG